MPASWDEAGTIAAVAARNAADAWLAYKGSGRVDQFNGSALVQRRWGTPGDSVRGLTVVPRAPGRVWAVISNGVQDAAWLRTEGGWSQRVRGGGRAAGLHCRDLRS